MKAVVLASFNMDLVMRAERPPRPGETVQGAFALHLGGKGFNQAVAARRAGAAVDVIGRVGDDAFGQRFLDALDRDSIGRRHVAIDAQAGTGVASIVVDATGENAIIQAPQANRRMTAADIDGATSGFEGAAVALWQLETSDEAAIAFARAARAAGAATIFNPAPCMPFDRQLLELSDVIVANELEAAALLSTNAGEDPAALAGALQRAHDAVAVVTCGPRGAVACDGARELRIAPHRVDAIDTVGAGDAFCGALAVALGEGAALDDALRFANAAGALAATKPGAEPSIPVRREIEQLMREVAR